MDGDLYLPVASLAALANGTLLLLLTLLVVMRRRAAGIVLGDGGDRVMLKRIRGQANAAEQIPIFLILLTLAEISGAHAGLLGATAAAFTLGRLLHAAYFAVHGLTWRLRFWGMWLTVLAQGAVLLLLAATLLAG